MDIQITIKELEADIKQRQQALAALRAVNGNGIKRSRNGQTIIGGVLEHLKNTKTQQTSEQLRQALAQCGVQATTSSFQSILSRRAKLRKDLVRIGRGVWGLKK